MILPLGATFLEVIWWMLIVFFWTMVIWMFISVFIDMFRRNTFWPGQGLKCRRSTETLTRVSTAMTALIWSGSHAVAMLGRSKRSAFAGKGSLGQLVAD